SIAPSSDLAPGRYTARAVQLDEAGNTGYSAPVTFVVDITPPTVTITSTLQAENGAALAAKSKVTTAFFAFTVADPLGGAVATGVSTVTCQLDSATPVDCKTAGTAWYPSVTEGNHTFTVTVTDAAGNSTSATHPWLVDTTIPTVSITARKTASDGATLNSPTNSTTVYFTFSTADPDPDTTGPIVPAGVASAMCSLDGAAYASCGSLTAKDYSSLPQGTHTFRVKAVDDAGNESAIAESTWFVDRTDPIVSLTAPTNGTNTNNQKPTFSGVAGIIDQDASAAESLDSATVTVTIYNGANASGTVADTLTATRNPSTGVYSVSPSANLPAGRYTARASQGDAAGNTGFSSSITFVVDIAAPTATIGSKLQASGGAALAAKSKVKTAYFVFSVEDADSGAVATGVATVTCQMDAETATDCKDAGTASYSELSDGTHTFKVTVTDLAGNSSFTTHEWLVDTTPPAVAITDASKPANPLKDTTSVTFAFTKSDGGSGIATTECSLDNAVTYGDCTSGTTYTVSSLTDGEHTVRIKVTDEAGNFSVASYTWRVDLNDPSVTLTQPGTLKGATYVTNDTTPTLAGVAGITAGDNSTLTVKIFSGSGTGGSVVQTLTGVAVDPATGAYTVDAATLADGTYTARAEQGDSVGHTGYSPARTFLVDFTKPIVQLFNKPPELTSGNSVSFQITVTDTGSTPDYIECKLDSGDWATCTSPKDYDGLADGSHTFSARAYDKAGNLSTTASHTWTIRTVTPVVTITSPVDGFNTNDGLLTISGSATPGADMTVTVDVYDPSDTLVVSKSGTVTMDPLDSTKGTYSITLDAALDPNQYRIVATETDSLFNSGTSGSIYVIVDTTAPTVTITQRKVSSSGANLLAYEQAQSAYFAWTRSDANSPVASGINTVTCKLDDGAELPCTTTRTYAGPLGEGSHTFTVKATDFAGNVRTVSHTWVIDRTAPAPTITAPTASQRLRTSTPTFSGAAGNAAIGGIGALGTSADNSTVTVKIYEGTGTTGTLKETITPTRTSATWTATAATLSDGTYTVTVTQGDVALNTSTPSTGASSQVTFTLDTTAPTAAILVPAADAKLKTATPVISGTATSATGDVAKVSLEFWKGTDTSGAAFRTVSNIDVTTGAWSHTAATLTDGTWTVKVTQVDDVGNSFTSAGRTFLV
ncbi:MAG: hypothetical protein RJB61_2498, partial [Actinomycetota bacterium]